MSAASCKRLDLEVMTNREVLGELTRIYGNLLDRVSSYCEVLEIEHEEYEGDGDVPDFDAIYDEAMGLVTRVEEMTQTFERGVYGDQRGRYQSKNGLVWTWGITTFKDRLKHRAVGDLVTGASDG